MRENAISGLPMAVTIEDEETGRLIRQLAERACEPLDTAVLRAVVGRLQRIPPDKDDDARRQRRLAEALAYFDLLPRITEHVVDGQLIRYDENGMPV
jgi:hypothetical protein